MCVDIYIYILTVGRLETKRNVPARLKALSGADRRGPVRVIVIYTGHEMSHKSWLLVYVMPNSERFCSTWWYHKEMESSMAEHLMTIIVDKVYMYLCSGVHRLFVARWKIQRDVKTRYPRLHGCFLPSFISFFLASSTWTTHAPPCTCCLYPLVCFSNTSELNESLLFYSFLWCKHSEPVKFSWFLSLNLL